MTSTSVREGPGTNWARNITFTASDLYRPSSVAELQTLVAAHSKVRAVGTGHSFNAIADSPGALISTGALPAVLEIDSAAGLVRVSGGTRYGELGRGLAAAGFALHNTGSLPHISVAGACATGTHGSGVSNTNLSDAVESVELVTADGELRRIDRMTGGDEFLGSVLALGRLGIVTELTMRVVPQFLVAQTVEEAVPAAQVEGRLVEILSSAYSVSVFTQFSAERLDQVWTKDKFTEGIDGKNGTDGTDGTHGTESTHGTITTAQYRWGGRPADGPRNPVPGMPAENATQQMGIPGISQERLPHFRLEFTPSSGDELQSEYLLPLEDAGPALIALSDMGTRIAPLLQISEIRAIASDRMWISPASERTSVAFHFTWTPDIAAVRPVLAEIEERLAPFGARPHWGKVFCTSNEVLRSLYPRIADFAALVESADPGRKFGNDLVDGWLGLS